MEMKRRMRQAAGISKASSMEKARGFTMANALANAPRNEAPRPKGRGIS